MTDSVAVFPPGVRLTDDSTGDPLSGAVLEFYDAGTTTPKTVYSDADLLTEIGTTVTTDSLGYPTSDGGTTKGLVYVGTAAYKLIIKTSGGATVASHDNIKGAITTFDSSDLSVTATRPVSIKSLDYTVLSGDQATVFIGNCTSADVVFTLPSAATVGAGWLVTIQHGGTANQVRVNTVSSQTMSSGATSFSTVFPLSFSGEEITLVSDGANWRITSHVGPLIKRAQGVITVADRLTAPPGSEVHGAIYLISGSPTGGWSSFAAQDLVQYTNSAWVKFTPPTDCGWRVYVQDEDAYYCFVGSAWVEEAATQANQETGTDVARFVTPGRQHFHPSAPKMWTYVPVSGGTPSISASYNLTSVTDTGVGTLTATIANDLSSANYCAIVSAIHDTATASGRTQFVPTGGQAAGSVQARSESGSGTAVDPVAYSIVVFGDL